jgi:hypothetical protein
MITIEIMTDVNSKGYKTYSVCKTYMLRNWEDFEEIGHDYDDIYSITIEDGRRCDIPNTLPANLESLIIQCAVPCFIKIPTFPNKLHIVSLENVDVATLPDFPNTLQDIELGESVFIEDIHHMEYHEEKSEQPEVMDASRGWNGDGNANAIDAEMNSLIDAESVSIEIEPINIEYSNANGNGNDMEKKIVMYSGDGSGCLIDENGELL